MPLSRGEGSAPLPQTIKVQGITINVGDPVLVLIDGQWVRRFFAGRDASGKAWMEITYWTSSMEQLPGPFPLDELRHPSLLDGIIREIDADD